jgi:hypothetical protein
MSHIRKNLTFGYKNPESEKSEYIMKIETVYEYKKNTG